MKKIITLLLTILMLSQLLMCPAVFAAVDTELVYDLSISDSTTPDAITTRGEFASMIAKVLYMDTSLQVTNTVYTFYDVSEEHDYYAEIEFLANMGIINGNGSGYFQPDRAITAEEASKMLVLALRYDLMVTDGNYQAVASSRKLFSGVQFTGNNFTHENAARIIANMLDADYDEMEGVNGGLSFNGETFMESRLGIYELTGTVTDDGLTSLTGDTGVEEGYIKVDGTVFSVSCDTAGLIGRDVTVYYRESDISSKWYDAITVKVLSSGDVAVLDGSYIVGYDDYTYEYETDSGKTKNYNISKTANIRYNGRILKFDTPVTEAEFNDFMHVKTGSVTLVNTDGGAYDFVDIISYKSMVVGSVFSVSDDEYTIYNKFDSSEVIKIDYEDTDYVITDTKGNGIYLDMIKNDDVISYAASHNGEWTRIIVSNNIFSKGIDEISDDSVIVDGTEYKFAPEYDASVSIGSVGTVYLNFLGEVVYISQGSGDGLLALFGGHDEGTGLGTNLKVQVFTEQGNLVELSIDKNVTIDGVRKTRAEAKKFFEDNDLMFKAVSVVYDSNKVLKKLDTPYSDCDASIALNDANETADTMHYIKNIKDRAGSSLSFNYYNTTFGGELIVDGNTAIFCYPSDAVNLEDASLASITEKYFTDSITHYTISAYTRKANSVYAQAIVLKGMEPKYDFDKDDYNSTPSIGVVTRITNTINNDGENAQRVYIETGSKIEQYATEDMDTLKCSKWSKNLCDIEVGDIVKYAVMSDNILYTKSIMPLVDASEDKVVSYTAPGAAWSARPYKGISEAYCVDIIDGYMEFSRTNLGSEINYSSDKTYVFRMGDTPVVVFDKEKEEATGGDINDFVASRVDEENATKFYYANDIGKPLLIVIYK